MARSRPTEVKAVVALLEAEADDVEELAERIIAALDEARAKREWYVAVARIPVGHGHVTYLASGPFTTRRQAFQDLEHLAAPGPEVRGLGRVVKLSPTHLV